MRTKTKLSFYSLVALLLITAATMSSCENKVVNIPSGFVGKKLTPTGYDKETKEAGQVDIGDEARDGTATSLVLLEVTTTTVKEQFLASGDGNDKEDHRVRTKDGTPLAVDIYVQMAVPVDATIRDGIFAQITPVEDPKQKRVSIISISSIYERFAKMTIRGNVRAMFARYKDADDVMANYEKINGEISQMIINVVKESKAPFQIVSAQLSNVKEDPTILESKNKLVAANNEVAAIEKVGDAIRKNPNYIEARKWDVIEKVGAKTASNLIVITDGKNSQQLTLPLPSK